MLIDQELQKKSYNDLGLNVIWVDDHKEIPNVIKSIRSKI